MNFGKIPAAQDQVTLGDVDRSRSHKIKVAFMIGLNDGVFPSVHKEEGYFNDKDRELLKDKGAQLAKGTIENLYEENYNSYKAFTIAEEELYISYPSADTEGKTLRPSIFITKLRKLFPKLKEQTNNNQEDLIVTKQNAFEELLVNLRKLKQGEEINPIWFWMYDYYKKQDEWKTLLKNALKGWNYTNLPQNLNNKNVEMLYGPVLKTSVSRLEQYQACPFSYYLKYGLKLSNQTTYKVEAVNTGSFMHEVIDEFFHKVKKEGKDIKQITEEEIRIFIEEIVNEKLSCSKYYIFTSNSKYNLLARRLKQVVTQSMKYIIESLKYSDFQVLGSEIEFKRGKEYPPIEIALDN